MVSRKIVVDQKVGSDLSVCEIVNLNNPTPQSLTYAQMPTRIKAVAIDDYAVWREIAQCRDCLVYISLLCHFGPCSVWNGWVRHRPTIGLAEQENIFEILLSYRGDRVEPKLPGDKPNGIATCSQCLSKGQAAAQMPSSHAFRSVDPDAHPH